MRNKQNRLNVNNLFVLGAGASFAATRPRASFTSEQPPTKQTPLDKHFTKVISELNRQRPNWVNGSVSTVLKGWRDHKQFGSLGLEQAILTHAANMKFVRAIRPRRSRNSIEFEVFMNHLAHLITHRLRSARPGREGVYEGFSEVFFNRKDTSNRIITFNYDDVLDKILLEKHALKDLYFSNLKPSQTSLPKSGGSDSPLLLKLHGSVNWNCHSDDFAEMIGQQLDDTDPLNIEDIWFRRTGCPSPDDNVSPCIIPPLESKPITSIELFRFLWTMACEYLHECKHLYLCGYSLPPTDALASALFKEFNNYGLETITVIDPDPAVMSRWRDLLSRKNVSKAQWMYYADFSEFVEACK